MIAKTHQNASAIGTYTFILFASVQFKLTVIIAYKIRISRIACPINVALLTSLNMMQYRNLIHHYSQRQSNGITC